MLKKQIASIVREERYSDRDSRRTSQQVDTGSHILKSANQQIMGMGQALGHESTCGLTNFTSVIKQNIGMGLTLGHELGYGLTNCKFANQQTTVTGQALGHERYNIRKKNQSRVVD